MCVVFRGRRGKIFSVEICGEFSGTFRGVSTLLKNFNGVGSPNDSRCVLVSVGGVCSPGSGVAWGRVEKVPGVGSVVRQERCVA